MHLVIAFLLQSAAVSSFLGGSYPGFKAPAPRKTPPTTSVCIVTDAEYSAAGDGVHDDTAAIRKVRDVGLHVPTPTRTHPPPASHQPPTKQGKEYILICDSTALHYTIPHRTAPRCTTRKGDCRLSTIVRRHLPGSPPSREVVFDRRAQPEFWYRTGR